MYMSYIFRILHVCILLKIPTHTCYLYFISFSHLSANNGILKSETRISLAGITQSPVKCSFLKLSLLKSRFELNGF